LYNLLCIVFQVFKKLSWDLWLYTNGVRGGGGAEKLPSPKNREERVGRAFRWRSALRARLPTTWEAGQSKRANPLN